MEPPFHLVVPASEANGDLCKTIASAFILDYPPPTLINFGKNFTGNSWDKGTHTGKIRGIYDFLLDTKEVKDQDLVLIIDGYDVWFQLPPEVLISRYQSIIESANKRLRKKYGTVASETVVESRKTERTPRYAQTILFAADKLCWPNSAEDPACAAIPQSTLPKGTYGPDTDKDARGFLNRPRYLNSGSIIGPTSALRAMYAYATDKVEKHGRGELGDQFVFGEIFGEQEYQREAKRLSSQSSGGRFLDRLSDAFSHSKSSGNTAMHEVTTVPGQQYEFGIGLDYESQLFQTMTHSHGDIEFLHYNDTTTLAHVQEEHHITGAHPISLPPDIRNARTPVPEKASLQTDESSTLFTTPHLDTITTNLTWSDIPLATNVHVPSIPAVLHFNGDKTYLSTWWAKMWYQPESRALLRHYMRISRDPIAANAAAAARKSREDGRGGKGGMWTDTAQWFAWGEVCRMFEEDVFGDGKGVWGEEEGVKKVYNSFGKLIQGTEQEEEVVEEGG